MFPGGMFGRQCGWADTGAGKLSWCAGAAALHQIAPYGGQAEQGTPFMDLLCLGLFITVILFYVVALYLEFVDYLL